MNGRTWRLGLVLVLASVWGGHAAAQGTDKKAEDTLKKADETLEEVKEVAKQAKEAIKKIATSGEDFSGDRLTLRTTVRGFELQRDASVKNKVAPAGTELRVLYERNENLHVEIVAISCKVAKPKEASDKAQQPGTEAAQTRAENPFLHWIGAASEVDCKAFTIEELVKPGEAYVIPKNTVVDHGFRRSGWVYGALLVPYKYHRYDKSFSSGATIGPYFGYRLDGLGFDTSVVASIGLASLPARNAGSGSTTLQGYSVAVGLIGSVNKNKSPLQIGLLVGKDWAGSNAAIPYEHEGRTWIAVQIGFSFSE